MPAQTLRLSTARAVGVLGLSVLLLVAGCGAPAATPGLTAPAPTATATPEPTPRPTPKATPRPTRTPSPSPSPTASPEPTPAPLALPAGAVSAAEAAGRVGEWLTVCDTVGSATYASDSAGAPTFLSLDGAYPNQALTLVIWEQDRWWYTTAPEILFAPGAQVCAEGFVETYNGAAEIEPGTPVTLMADWVPASASTDLDCASVADPEMADICWGILDDIAQINEEAYQDVLDDLYDDPYYP